MWLESPGSALARHIFTESRTGCACSAAVFSNPDFMIHTIKSGQAGTTRVEIGAFIIHKRVTPTLETW